MKPISVAASRPAIEIALWRYGWAWVLAAILLVGALVGHLLILQPGRQMQEDLQVELLQERLGAPAKVKQSRPPEDDEQRLRALRAVLNFPLPASELVRKMAVLAEAEQIRIAQSEYRQQVNSETGVTRVQITQPLGATYPQLRRYIEAVLRAMPNASLDQVVAKRENVGQSQVEARLKWSLWILAAPPTPAPARTEGMP